MGKRLKTRERHKAPSPSPPPHPLGPPKRKKVKNAVIQLLCSIDDNVITFRCLPEVALYPFFSLPFFSRSQHPSITSLFFIFLYFFFFSEGINIFQSPDLISAFFLLASTQCETIPRPTFFFFFFLLNPLEFFLFIVQYIRIVPSGYGGAEGGKNKIENLTE